MSANPSWFECCTLCCPRSNNGGVEEKREHDPQHEGSKEDHQDALDPEITQHRFRFLDYPYTCEISTAQSLHNFEETQISIAYRVEDDVPRETWNSAFAEVVENRRVTDLRLRLTTEADDAAPDFAILLRCPLKSFWIEKRLDLGGIPPFFDSIPEAIIEALGSLSALEALTIFDLTSSDSLIALLNSGCFPKLHYLNVRLGKSIDFGKFGQLTVLKVAIQHIERLDLKALTELRALEVSAGGAVVELCGNRNHLKWLHTVGKMEIEGDVSAVSHLLISTQLAKFGIIRRCSNLKQLSLVDIIFDSPISIPASVDRLFIQRCLVSEMELPAGKTFQVLSLYNVRFRSKVSQALKSTHLRLRDDNSLTELGQSLRETALGSPQSVVVECRNSRDGDGSPASFLGALLEKEEFRRDIQFFATNIPLVKPLPPMPKLRELCLATFADVQQIQDIGKVMLFLDKVDTIADDGAAVQKLREIAQSLLVPEGSLKCVEDLGLNVQVATALSPEYPSEYASYLWADHVKRSSGEFDVNFDVLVQCRLF